jgi:peptidoglycan/LPS O-acetylase OafA/YrhL
MTLRTDHGYRPDIDGLRAIAVGLVIVFHGRFGLVPGGFIGVDVFFVISGYLISSIIWRELAGGGFSFAHFYERRIRRIFPALIVVLAATLLMGALLFAPQDYVVLGRSAKATAAFYSNFFFYDQAGYFMPGAETQPLLHTWSLAVEEQFYLVAPFFLIGLAKIPPHYRTPAFALVFLTSLVISATGANSEDTGAFYLPHSRAFELMIGMALALGMVPVLSKQTYREAAGLSGMAMILAAALLFTDRTPFPGFAALLPCVGTALLIASANQGTNLVARALSLRPVVFLGKISYSLYLWHWPIFVFADYEFGTQLSPLQRVGLVGLAIALSCLTYWFVEQPARQKTPLLTRKRAITYGLSAMVLVVVAAQVIILTRGLPERLPPKIAQFAQDVAESKVRPPCPEIDERIGVDSPCEIGLKSASKASFLLWGDSHARMVSPQLSKIAESKGLKGFVVVRGGCAPFSASAVVGTLFEMPKCAGLSVRVMQLLKSENISHVIIAARWASFAEGSYYRNGIFVTNQFDTGSDAKDHSAFEHALRRTIDEIRASGHTVTLLGPIPELSVHLPNAMIKAMMRKEPVNFSVPFSDFSRRQFYVLETLKQMGAVPHVQVLYPHLQLCNTLTCETSKDEMPLYTDDNHLGLFGTDVINQTLTNALEPRDTQPLE